MSATSHPSTSPRRGHVPDPRPRHSNIRNRRMLKQLASSRWVSAVRIRSRRKAPPLVGLLARLKRSTAALRCQIGQSVAQNAREFVTMARKELEHELQLLNETIPRNEKVIIISGAAKTGFRSRRSSQPERRGWPPSNRSSASAGRRPAFLIF